MLKYLEIYKDKLIQISFYDAKDNPKFITAYIINEDDNMLICRTIKQEIVGVRKDKITTITDKSNSINNIDKNNKEFDVEIDKDGRRR